MTISQAFKKFAAALLITVSLASATTPALARGTGGGDGTDADHGCSGGCTTETPTQNNQSSDHTPERPQDQCYLDLRNPTLLADGRIAADIYLLRSHGTRQRVNQAFNNQHGDVKLLLDIDDKKAVFASQQAFTAFEASHTFSTGLFGMGDKKVIPQELGGIGDHEMSDRQLWERLCPSSLRKLDEQPGIDLIHTSRITAQPTTVLQFVPVAR